MALTNMISAHHSSALVHIAPPSVFICDTPIPVSSAFPQSPAYNCNIGGWGEGSTPSPKTTRCRGWSLGQQP